MTAADSYQHVLIGTAGHIDHGKTRLVARLTGVDTDRLPEEKSRGISIDLGFAHWERDGFRFGVVDVPGHEKFVKNMVAGATGINLALMVVAADDSVMPQTREHLEIMDLLGVQMGLVAITKTDLVDAEFVELVQAEVEELVAGTFLEGCPLIPVSSETGAGFAELQDELAHIAGQIEWPQGDALFRMPVDRVFSLPGHGTIGTGSVLSGDVHPGDALELLPEQRSVRVRSVESHGSQADDSGPRTRTAVNLAGLKTGEIQRGQELATPGFLQPSTRLLVELRSLSSSPLVLKDRLELSLHLGTAEALVRLVLKGRVFKPGERGFAELRSRIPVVAAYGQRFILRRVSPAVTLAGGTVLDPFIPPGKRIRDLEAAGMALSQSSQIGRLSYVLSQQDRIDTAPLWATWKTGLSSEQYAEFLGQLRSDNTVLEIGVEDRQRLIHRDRLESLSRSVMRTIRAELERQQPRRALPKNTLLTACRGIADDDLLEIMLDHLVRKKQLAKVGEQLGPADLQVKLTKKQQRWRETILQSIAESHLTPPTNKELADAVGQTWDQIEPLLHLCVEDGLLIKIGKLLYFTPQAVDDARIKCGEFLATEKEATLSQLREVWKVSRKFAVPLCEYFDEQGITVRDGDLRRSGPRM